jgi:hypothetical protein
VQRARHGYSGPADRSPIPWQNAYVERLIGTIRRECLDHVIVFGEAHLRRILDKYATYYNESRIHRSLDKDAPFHRVIERLGAITHHSLSLAAFITNIAESNFRYTQWSLKFFWQWFAILVEKKGVFVKSCGWILPQNGREMSVDSGFVRFRRRSDFARESEMIPPGNGLRCRGADPDYFSEATAVA